MPPQNLWEKFVLKLISKLYNVHKAEGHNEQSKTSQMNNKKENVQVNWGASGSQIWLGFLVFKGRDFRIDNPDLEEDDDIEEEGDEDVADAAEDPGGEGSQSDWIRRSRPQSRDEEVDQHLNANKWGKNIS